MISAEEQGILDRIGISKVPVAQFDERDTEVVRKMVSRGLLNSVEIDGKVNILANSAADVWRN